MLAQKAAMEVETDDEHLAAAVQYVVLYTSTAISILSVYITIMLCYTVNGMGNSKLDKSKSSEFDGDIDSLTL